MKITAPTLSELAAMKSCYLWTCAALAACATNPVMAEKADRNKPMQIQADRLEVDDIKKISVYSGNVILTKGTILLRADKLTVSEDAQGFQMGLANGKPGQLASFRQKREGVDQYVEGYGERVDYNGKNETVRFSQKAQLRRLEKEKVTDQADGAVIIWDSRTEFFTVESGITGQTVQNPNGRVKVTIQPKNQDDAAPVAPKK